MERRRIRRPCTARVAKRRPRFQVLMSSRLVSFTRGLTSPSIRREAQTGTVASRMQLCGQFAPRRIPSKHKRKSALKRSATTLLTLAHKATLTKQALAVVEENTWSKRLSPLTSVKSTFPEGSSSWSLIGKCLTAARSVRSASLGKVN